MPSRIRTDDEVIVIGGKDRGKRGKVLRVEPKKDRVYVEGLNMIKRHQRPNTTTVSPICASSRSSWACSVVEVRTTLP